MFLEGWNETILIGIQTFVWPIRTWEKQYFDAQNKKDKNKSNERKQITDLISDVNLKLVLVPLGGFRGVKKTLMWMPEKGNKNLRCAAIVPMNLSFGGFSKRNTCFFLSLDSFAGALHVKL